MRHRRRSTSDPASYPPSRHGQPLLQLLLPPGSLPPFLRHGGLRRGPGRWGRGGGAANPLPSHSPIRQRFGAGHPPRCGGGGAHGGSYSQGPPGCISVTVRIRSHRRGGGGRSGGQARRGGDCATPSCGESQSPRCPQGSTGQSPRRQPVRRFPIRPEWSRNPVPGPELQPHPRPDSPSRRGCHHTPFQSIHPFLPHG